MVTASTATPLYLMMMMMMMMMKNCFYGMADQQKTLNLISSHDHWLASSEVLTKNVKLNIYFPPKPEAVFFKMKDRIFTNEEIT